MPAPSLVGLDAKQGLEKILRERDDDVQKGARRHSHVGHRDRNAEGLWPF